MIGFKTRDEMLKNYVVNFNTSTSYRPSTVKKVKSVSIILKTSNYTFKYELIQLNETNRS